MLETEEMKFVEREIQEDRDPIEKKGNSLPRKGQELLSYLKQKEETEILLLDMLRAREMSQKEYDELIKQRQSAYQTFLKNLTEDEQVIACQ